MSTIATHSDIKTWVPELRFPEFEREWQNSFVNKVFKINAGGDIDKSHVSEQKSETHPYPIFANAEKRKGLYAYSDIYKVSGEVVTVAGRGVNIGIAHARKEPFYPIVRLLVLKPLEEQSVDFFEHELNNINLYVESTGVPQLTAPQFATYKITYPSLPEQQKIASFLSAVDEKIQQLSRKKALLEEYKKGVMQQIFSQQIRFKDENGNPYPDWAEKRLADIAEFLKGKGISKSEIDENGDLKCIRYGELYTHYTETINEIKSRTNVNSSELVLSKANDIIIPASGETQLDIATASCVLHEGIALGGDLNIIRSKADGVFMAYYMNNAIKHDIARLSQGISVVHLYSSQLKTLKLSLPSLAEQKAIASFLRGIEMLIEKNMVQTEELQLFKKGLLQKMFVAA